MVTDMLFQAGISNHSPSGVEQFFLRNIIWTLILLTKLNVKDNKNKYRVHKESRLHGCLFLICFAFACQDFKLLKATASKHGTPSLSSLQKDDEVSCEVRPPKSPIRSLTSLDRA